MVVCSRCGTQSPDGTNFCPKCGQNLAAPSGPPPYQPYGQSLPSQQVPNFLVWAILVTLFCCLPFGIISIIYAVQVDGKVSSGDLQGALRQIAELMRDYVPKERWDEFAARLDEIDRASAA